MKVSVIGAGGHVGLPLTVAIAAGLRNTDSVFGVELDQKLIDRLNIGDFSFFEEGLPDYFHTALNDRQNLIFGLWNDKAIQESDYIVIIVGTPTDEEGNPRVDGILRIADQLSKLDLQNKTIILRSTVSPGTTELFRNRLGDHSRLTVAFCPERIQQNNAMKELFELPQIIGLQCGSPDVVRDFFNAWSKVKLIETTAKKAELGKLFTNMARYIEFAVANEFQQLADQFDEDSVEILDNFSDDYPRLKIAGPGPAAGPCLAKDGKFLLKYSNGGSLVEEAFKVNEGVPKFLVNKLINYGKVYKTPVKKVLILGAAFKPESDDIRFSLSFKLKKLLTNEGLEVEMYDPWVYPYNTYVSPLIDFDAFVIMTPHECFFDQDGILSKIEQQAKSKSVILDPWRKVNKTNILEIFP